MRSLLLTLVLIFPLAAMAAPNPEKVAQVQAGTEKRAVVSWWGFNADDSTEFMQAAVNSGAPQVVVPFVGAPWVVRPIKLRSDLELIFEPGVVVLAKPGEFKGKGDSLFSVADATNVAIRGYGATLRMRKADYQSEAYEKAEWRMTLDFVGCTNVTVEGVRLESSGGDGIYIGCTSNQPYCRDVVIRNVVCHDHHRQGISVIGASNLLIENCVMSGTNGTAPQAGIDLEPNSPEERLENCVIRNCIFEDNTGAGMLVYLRPLSKKTPDVSILFENCHVRSGKDAGIAVGAIKDDGPKGTIEFRNCTVENTQGSGAYVYDKSAENARVVFTDCKWNNVATKGDRPPILFHARRDSLAATLGGVDLTDCRLYDNQDRPAVIVEGEEGTKARDITGVLAVVSPATPRMEVKIPAESVNFQLQPVAEKDLVPVAVLEYNRQYPFHHVCHFLTNDYGCFIQWPHGTRPKIYMYQKDPACELAGRAVVLASNQRTELE